jgi:hypothetical protein
LLYKKLTGSLDAIQVSDAHELIIYNISLLTMGIITFTGKRSYLVAEKL